MPGANRLHHEHSGEPLPPGVVLSPDVLRRNRLPPGQRKSERWPVLDASGPPRIELASWRLRVDGLVARPGQWSWEEFAALPRVKVYADFHCVTGWSRLGNLWEGVSTRELLARCGGARPEARFVLVHAWDRGWTTNLPLEEFLAEDVLIATHHDGRPLTLEHGGPARLVVPRLYAWKSAKWVARIELMERDRAGFWESHGYHMRGNPWKEERYGW
ncbi:MAG: sulfite oxidase-like oxidoreductase [Bryobacteraceae bacterium]|nr:sulfite oxidase-like oxidoreductase [Bryobacteraceae bacterium]